MNLRGSLRRTRSAPASGPRRWLIVALWGAHGVRPPVRVLLYIALVALAAAALSVTIHLTLLMLPALHARVIAAIHQARSAAGARPGIIIAQESAFLACALVATWAMTRLEGIRLRDVGLRAARRVRDLAWGLAVGFLLLALLVAALMALGAGTLAPPTIGVAAALGWGLAWLTATMLIGAFEEIVFRGYLLSMLRERYGFWPAAIAVSGLFTLAHAGNPGEQPMGLLTVGLVSVFFCLAIRRTGSLWWVIGCHAAWDWSENFFFGSADSGMHSMGRLLTLTPRGPALLSGGTVGPEGSILCLAVQVLAILAVPLIVPRQRAAEPGAPDFAGS